MKSIEEQIKHLLTNVGHGVELSVLTHELNGDSTAIIHAAYAMSQDGQLWWLDVNEDHAIVGLPDQPKPEKPLEYLGLVEAEDGALIPADLLQYGISRS